MGGEERSWRGRTPVVREPNCRCSRSRQKVRCGRQSQRWRRHSTPRMVVPGVLGGRGSWVVAANTPTPEPVPWPFARRWVRGGFGAGRRGEEERFGVDAKSSGSGSGSTGSSRSRSSSSSSGSFSRPCSETHISSHKTVFTRVSTCEKSRCSVEGWNDPLLFGGVFLYLPCLVGVFLLLFVWCLSFSVRCSFSAWWIVPFLGGVPSSLCFSLALLGSVVSPGLLSALHVSFPCESTHLKKNNVIDL